MKQRLFTILFLVTILSCNKKGNFNEKLFGDSRLSILKPNDSVGDIFGPRLGFEFLTKDSLRHSLAIVSMTDDSIRFVLIRQTKSDLLEYYGYAIRNRVTPDTIDFFLSQGKNHILEIRISKDRQNAELICLDKEKNEIYRVSQNEIVSRQENAR